MATEGRFGALTTVEFSKHKKAPLQIVSGWASGATCRGCDSGFVLGFLCYFASGMISEFEVPGFQMRRIFELVKG